MENIIPAVTGELIEPLLRTSNWEPLQDVEIILYKGIIEPELDTGEGTEDTPEPEEEINGWIRNTDENQLYIYSQQVECKGIKESSKFFVDLAIDKYDDIEDIFTIQDEWALISRVISNGTKETDGTLTFYIYEDSVPTLDLHVRVRFANT